MDEHDPVTPPAASPATPPPAAPATPSPAAPSPIAATPAQTDALDRIKAALAEAQPRGSNWMPVTVPIGRGKKAKLAKGYFNPVVRLYADDICTVAEMVPEAKRDRTVNDLFDGSDEHCGQEAPKEVHIHVDDAWHLADLASGLDPVPPRQPNLPASARLPAPEAPASPSKRAQE